VAYLGIGQTRREGSAMTPERYRLGLGVCDCCLIREEGTLLINAG
jgi:hypothetical protein